MCDPVRVYTYSVTYLFFSSFLLYFLFITAHPRRATTIQSVSPYDVRHSRVLYSVTSPSNNKMWYRLDAVGFLPERDYVSPVTFGYMLSQIRLSVVSLVCNVRVTKSAVEIFGNVSSVYTLFLPRCMECRRGLAMRKLSVRLSNAWIVTKRKKDLSRFLYHTKDHLT